MNEFKGIPKECLVSYQRATPELAAQRAFVGAYEVKAGVDKAWSLSAARIAEISQEARATWLEDRDAFRQAFFEEVSHV